MGPPAKTPTQLGPEAADMNTERQPGNYVNTATTPEAAVRPQPVLVEQESTTSGQEETVPTSVAIAVPVDHGQDSSDYDGEAWPPHDLTRRRIPRTRRKFVEVRRWRRRASNGRHVLEFQLEWKSAEGDEQDPRPPIKRGWTSLSDC